MVERVTIDGVELILSEPDVTNLEWIGGDVYLSQLRAAWLLVDPHDIPLNPQILGVPGIGKTTLAYTAAVQMGRPVYIFQCTVDTRPEDLLISPVIGENNTIKYHASSLVTAMIKGGICILDEANRMAEKSWASLAPLLDQRRYVESIIAGIKIVAHPDFRVCVTMNEDSSTFEIPEYIHSRLQPQIFVEFPEKEEEIRILQFNLPFAKEELIKYTVDFLQQAHQKEKRYSVRDGINICRYYLKLAEVQKIKRITPIAKESENSPVEKKNEITSEENKFPSNSTNNLKKSSKLNHNNKEIPSIDEVLFHQAVLHILGEDAINFWFHHNLKENRKRNGQSSPEDDEIHFFEDDEDQKRQKHLDFDADDWEIEDGFDHRRNEFDDDGDYMEGMDPDDMDDEFDPETDPNEVYFNFKSKEDYINFIDKRRNEKFSHESPSPAKKGDPIGDFLERIRSDEKNHTNKSDSRKKSKSSK
jgi:hypothetical protein